MRIRICVKAHICTIKGAQHPDRFCSFHDLQIIRELVSCMRACMFMPGVCVHASAYICVTV